MSTQYANGKIVTSGLILALDAADRNSYSGSGTNWKDMSGNGYSGSLINGPTFDSANGGSIFTDGTNDFVDTNYFGSATDNYTFSVWFKNDNYSENKFILSRGRDGFGDGWSLFNIIRDTGYASIGVVPTIPSTVGISVDSTSVLALNKWYYITGVWTAGISLQVSINGILENTTVSVLGKTTLRSSSSGWVLGTISNGNFTSGYTAICHVYNRVLSSSEITQNYNAQKSRFNL
jgi:hypothetical protein